MAIEWRLVQITTPAFSESGRTRSINDSPGRLEVPEQVKQYIELHENGQPVKVAGDRVFFELNPVKVGLDEGEVVEEL